MTSLLVAFAITVTLDDHHGKSAPVAKPAPTVSGAKKSLGNGSSIRVYAPEPEMTVALAVEKLKEGNARFAKRKTQNPHRDTGRLAEVAKSQAPFAAVLGCADSRLSPELIFDQGFGDLFVVRVAGNVVDLFGTASMEYCVEHLGAKVIIVLGHERCGAVKAACDTFASRSETTVASMDTEGHAAMATSIPSLIEHIMPSVNRAATTKPFSLIDTAIAFNAQDSKKQLLSGSPMIKAMVAKGELKVLSGVYDLDTGLVKLLD
ncbi:MAG: carbonic anhydrase [Armatimonadetes bacterium]|nr:carbonic anhydrase [Armatimonadota bacterium]